MKKISTSNEDRVHERVQTTQDRNAGQYVGWINRGHGNKKEKSGIKQDKVGVYGGGRPGSTEDIRTIERRTESVPERGVKCGDLIEQNLRTKK